MPTRSGRVAAIEQEVKVAITMLPEHLRKGMFGYVLDGTPVGGFLSAAIENDFVTAICKADPQSMSGLLELAHFLYNVCPARSWGSKEKREAWISSGGARGFDGSGI